MFTWFQNINALYNQQLTDNTDYKCYFHLLSQEINILPNPFAGNTLESTH